VLSTPDNIRTLQRKLYRKAKHEPAFRFYALYDKVCRADILRHAYDRVRANKGSAGIDGVTFEAIRENEGEPAFLAELGKALRPEPVRTLRALQGADHSRLDKGACRTVKNIGKPCAGKPHARFDEGGLGTDAMVQLLRHRQTKGPDNR
jgi:hypothetical protein